MHKQVNLLDQHEVHMYVYISCEITLTSAAEVLVKASTNRINGENKMNRTARCKVEYCI